MNLISIPLKPVDTSLNVVFSNAIDGDEISERHYDGRWLIATYYTDYGWWSADGFTNIARDKGYFYKTTVSQTISIEGVGWDSPTIISLVEGYNSIGIPINDPTIQTAADLLTKIGANCNEIFKWDAVAQAWISYNAAMPPQAAFPIVAGEGYFISMLGSGELILEGESWCTPTGRTPPCGNYGDVDNDGYVTVNDAILVANYAVGGWANVSADTPLTESEFVLRAEVNADGVVDMADSTYIANYAMYVPGYDTFPICEVCPTPSCTFTIT